MLTALAAHPCVFARATTPLPPPPPTAPSLPLQPPSPPAATTTSPTRLLRRRAEGFARAQLLRRGGSAAEAEAEATELARNARGAGAALDARELMLTAALPLLQYLYY